MFRNLIRRQRLLPAAATSYNCGAAATPYRAQLQFSTRTRRNDISKSKRNTDSSSSSSVHHSKVSSKSSSATTDWRDWFRSSDYDDAWSPYYSFQTSDEALHNNNNNNSSIILQAATEYQKNIIPSIVNGTWERRRHGMNLEPICMAYRGIKAIEEYEARKRAAKVDHEDGEYDAEELDDEELIIISKARERMQRMDAQSRFLCRMLDDCYRTGKWRENDRPRTERCHRVSCCELMCEHFMCVLSIHYVCIIINIMRILCLDDCISHSHSTISTLF